MDSCTNMEAFRQSLIKTVNSCGLTVGGALFVVKDIYNTLYVSYLEELQKEQTRKTSSTEIQEYQVNPEEEVVENGEQNND